MHTQTIWNRALLSLTFLPHRFHSLAYFASIAYIVYPSLHSLVHVGSIPVFQICLKQKYSFTGKCCLDTCGLYWLGHNTFFLSFTPRLFRFPRILYILSFQLRVKLTICAKNVYHIHKRPFGYVWILSLQIQISHHPLYTFLAYFATIASLATFSYIANPPPHSSLLLRTHIHRV